ncbi:uncharacterized protein LOC124358546 [Homalodisca vitripennis]|uniref:uncharacterized protein LOC124358546 n=1 Tax=Homalodisca vitripennis TaxID=197043 RepID=UPI001EEA321D|nr:uncharacterized protein LOC124358546 [Homalodisca vitripennis]
MAMKELAMRLQPLPLYFILSLTVCLFFLELVIAHVTHSLTLLLDAYHALCNIIVLVGSIISIKHGSGRSDSRASVGTNSHEELKSLKSLSHQPQLCSTKPGPERQLRNTFGWARVDVIVMLIGCVFLASLCFSVLVEALQTLVHISHHDEMHAPIPVLIVGILAMVLNLLAYLLIGGYTFHQSSFLINGNETATKVFTEEEIKKQAVAKKTEKRQGMWGLSRDCVGCVVVIICAIVVHNSSSDVAKYVDPLFSIISATLVLLLSYPFMKESCLILLQTIPDHINIGSLCSQLVSAFPDIVNVHELHVWRLTVDKTYCTAHIIFLNPKEYTRITNDISRFFLDQGITHVTIQPEFYKDLNKADLLSSNSDCLVQCKEDLCMERHCCASRSPSLESVQVNCQSLDLNKADLLSSNSDCLVQCNEDLCMERHCCASRSPSLESVQDLNKADLLSSNSDCLVQCKEDLCMERHCCASRSPSLESVQDLNKADLLSSNSDCLVQCNEDLCMERHCCASRSPSLESVQDLNKADLLSSNSDCLVQCNEDLCMERHCCASRSPSLVSVQVNSQSLDLNKADLLSSNSDCLVQCNEDLCMERHCCASRSPSLVSVQVNSQSLAHNSHIRCCLTNMKILG